MSADIITIPSAHRHQARVEANRPEEHPALEDARNAYDELGHAAAKLAKIILLLRCQAPNADLEFALDLADEAAGRVANAHIHAEGVVQSLECA
jgi:hypothetical protein